MKTIWQTSDNRIVVEYENRNGAGFWAFIEMSDWLNSGGE